jgi:amidase
VNILAAFNVSLEIIKELGATIVDPADFPDADELLVSRNSTTVLSVDLKVRVIHTRS